MQLYSSRHNLSHPVSVALSYDPTVFSAVLFAARLDEGLNSAQKNGFDAVEIGLRDPEMMVDVSLLSEKLDKHALKLSAIATGQSYLHDGLSLFTEHEEVRKKAVGRMLCFVTIASRFGAYLIVGGIRGKLIGKESDHQRQWDLGIQALREVADFASEKNVTLLLEPINRYETNLINSAEEGLQVLTEVGAPNIKLLMDTFHMNIEEKDMSFTIGQLKDMLGYIHFADSNRYAPGQGHIDFNSIIDALDKINYTGYISVEVLPVPSDEKAISLSGEFLKQHLTLSG